MKGMKGDYKATM